MERNSNIFLLTGYLIISIAVYLYRYYYQNKYRYTDINYFSRLGLLFIGEILINIFIIYKILTLK